MSDELMENNMSGDLNRANSSFISIQNLEKIYPNGAKAVYNFNLDIKKNEFIVIVGPSGCGKTTTLRMVAGLEDISAGDVYINKEYVNYKPSKDRNIAIVFQSYALYPQMSVYDNIAFPLTINKYKMSVVAGEYKALNEEKEVLSTYDFLNLKNLVKKSEREAKEGGLEAFEVLSKKLNISFAGAKKISSISFDKEEVDKNSLLKQIDDDIATEKSKLDSKGIKINDQYQVLDDEGNLKFENRKLTKYEIREKVFNTAKILDLGQYLGRLPKELSGGQMQRVALGRAIVKNVPLFLMDEPLSNLDAKLRLTMRSEIVKLHDKIGATTIYVTHDQTEAMTMASRIVVMSKGFIQQIDAPKAIYDNPKNVFVAKFIGSPSINILNGSYDPKENVLKIEENIDLKMDASFKEDDEKFYVDKLVEFKDIFASYDEDYHAREFILKVLSSIGNEESKVFKAVKKENFFNKIIKLFKKKNQADTQDEYKDIFEEKIKEIEAAKGNKHNVVIAIRPERVSLKLKEQGKEYKNSFFVKPTVCELLGNEYIIHFDFLGKEMRAKMDAKISVDMNSELVLSFKKEDLLFFDAITGERIK